MESNISFVSNYLSSNDKLILDRAAKISILNISDDSQEVVVEFNFTNEIFTTVFEEDNEWLYHDISLNIFFYSDDNTISSVHHIFNVKCTDRTITDKKVFITFKSN